MKTTSKASIIILSLCEVIVGILLLMNPVSFTTGVIIFLGIVLIIVGIAGVVQYFRDPPEVAVLKKELVRGCAAILGGLFCVTKSGWFIVAFPILTRLYGIVVLVTGLIKVQWTIDKIRLKQKHKFWTALNAVLTILFAVIVLCNPFSSTAFLWTFIAVGLIVEAVIDIIMAIFTKEKAI